MSLASVFNTARSAISAAEMALGVTSNNLANVQSDGFKASQTVFATATPTTRSWGTSPSGRSGGTNAIQSGTGVHVAAVVPDFRPGPVVGSSNPLDLARELSNASIEDGLIDLSRLSTLFRVNLPVLQTADSLLDDLLNLQLQ